MVRISFCWRSTKPATEFQLTVTATLPTNDTQGAILTLSIINASTIVSQDGFHPSQTAPPSAPTVLVRRPLRLTWSTVNAVNGAAPSLTVIYELCFNYLAFGTPPATCS
jgi:hypothetical protein